MGASMASEKRKRSEKAEPPKKADSPAEEKHRLERENRTLRQQLAACREECANIEKRVGQLLHDGVCQDLSAAAFYLQVLKTQMARNDTAAAAKAIECLSNAVNQAVDSTHGLSRELRK
jgi:signal transduction histidine kinase